VPLDVRDSSDRRERIRTKRRIDSRRRVDVWKAILRNSTGRLTAPKERRRDLVTVLGKACLFHEQVRINTDPSLELKGYFMPKWDLGMYAG